MIQTNQKQFPSGLRSVLEVPGICRSPGRERGTRTMWLLPALLLLLLPAKSATTHPPEPVTPFAPASLAPSPPIVQSGNSSLSLARGSQRPVNKPFHQRTNIPAPGSSSHCPVGSHEVQGQGLFSPWVQPLRITLHWLTSLLQPVTLPFFGVLFLAAQPPLARVFINESQ
ncbi:uncharacterized protein LOC119065301 isoform X2 [Artibeus jamaicensis]|uniref:uncharacterized protein LOC119065301 isoform X2 n=1 Tax=Artibeus jamaicensis TaxID=9417 RepID=UPI00235B18D8|nr:uncharacterized protein LOC119065301 isoform X2 [Artibeus jamaicensis]